MWYELFKFFPFRPLVKWGFRARIIHPENVPDHGGAILASNHLSSMDSIVLPAMLPRRLTFPAKAELFVGRDARTKVVAWFLTAIGQVPMDRSGGRASASSLGTVTDVLAEGGLVGIYPEGTRSPDGRLYKGKTGAARMALTAEVPIVPVGIIGTETVRGPFGLPWLRRPQIVIGSPLDFSEYAHVPGNSAVLRHVTNEVMTSIQNLTGQEYADVYAFRVKSGDLKEVGSDDYVKPSPGGGPGPEV